jgi:hypothetical protein
MRSLATAARREKAGWLAEQEEFGKSRDQERV